ncbi:MarR family winged helix-turn-helix transcriptional regulator [Altererythrobacter aquiaggeris]|uniref:MarR family winged helix-turn-helix transcriptional regulator n=1 Tax=Aestuarierythrobacter aquiaggeris TaxID=1898396 RepID=UPI003018DE68
MNKASQHRMARHLRENALQQLNLAKELDGQECDNDEYLITRREIYPRNVHAQIDYDLGLVAENLYRERRHRDQYFESSLFGEPAWDILLDLFLHRAKGVQITVTSACLASSVPATTALRWINVLIDQGLVAKMASKTDARVQFLYLSPKGILAIRNYLLDSRGQLGRSANVKLNTSGSFEVNDHGKRS